MPSVSGSQVLVGVLLVGGVALGGWLAFAPREPQPTGSRAANEAASTPATPAASTPAASTLAALTTTAAPSGLPSASPPFTGSTQPSADTLHGLPPYSGPAEDRQRADQLRDALTALLAGKLAAQDSDEANAAPTAAGSAQERAPVLDGYIQSVMEDHFAPLVSRCYEGLLKLRPQLAGSVVLQFSILGDRALGGVVVDATLGAGTTLKDKVFERCITEGLYAAIFEAPPAGHPTVSVMQALELEP